MNCATEAKYSIFTEEGNLFCNRDPATLSCDTATHKRCEQLQRQQLIKWSDSVLSEKCLQKN